MQFNRAKLDIDGNVAVLTLDHAEVMNAVSTDMLDGLSAALDAIQAAGTVRCLVLTGTGRAFCTGANLSPAEGAGLSGDAGRVLESHFHPFLKRLRNLPMPVVAAVNGPAAGAGMSIALMADLIVAARSAYFLQAFRRIGLVPDCGSTWLLPRLIGRARSLELSLLGDKLPAEKALEWGLINRVADDEAVMTESLALARDLAAGPTVALGLIRDLYWHSEQSSFGDQLDHERQAQRRAGDSADFKEGIAAFREKRPAKFEGR